jgi:NAD(P)-dependent dehydrogenase (short-subunit alcohol dehydrogenase family)
MSAARRVAVVTGASRGIGRCAAIALARRGYDVVITARTVHEGDGRAHASSVLAPDDPMPIAGSLDTTVAQIEAVGRTCLAVPMDLMDRASVERVAAVALSEMGRVDVLVNNAIYQGPGSHHQHLVAQALGLVHLVRDEEHGGAILVQLTDGGPDVAARGRVQALG